MNDIPYIFKKKFKRIGKDEELLVKLINSVTQALQESKQNENPLTYFMSLLSLLGDKQTNAMNGNILKLINMIFSEIPSNVLIVKFEMFARLFIQLYEKFQNSENVVIPLIQSITNLLKEQQNNAWLNSQVLHSLFNILLITSSDSKESISFKSKRSIAFILSSKKPACTQMMSQTFEKHLENLVEKTSIKSYNTTLQFLEVLNECFVNLSPNSILGISNSLVKLFSLQQNSLNKEILKIFENYFSNEISIPPQSVVQIIQNFASMKVNIQEETVALHYSKMIYVAYMKVYNFDKSVANLLLSLIFSKLITLLESKKKGVAIHGYNTLNDLIHHSISDEMIVEIYSKQQKDCLLMKLINQLHQCLSLKYSSNLDFVFQILANVFKRLGRKSYPIMTEVLVSMEKLHDSKHDKSVIQLEKAIGNIIAAMGTIPVLTILPLNLFEETERKWLLPLLRENGSNAELSYFIKHLLPLDKKAIEQSSQVNSYAEKQLKTLHEQIWFLLPTFSVYATDFPKSFPMIVDLLLEPLQDERDLRNTICTTFHKVISKNREIVETSKIPQNIETSVDLAKKTLEVLASYSETFFPIFFNIYDECNQLDRVLVLRAISAFASITPTKIVNDYFKSMLKKLLTATNEIESEDLSHDERQEKISKKYIMADLALAMSENLPNASIDIFYKVIKPQLSDEDATTQKKSYRAFLEIIKKKSNIQVEEIYETLKETLSVCKPSSKKFRFKCFVELITEYDLVEKFIPQLIGEAIMGNKELNAETRDLSLELLRALINKYTFGAITFDSENVTEQQQQKLCVFMKQLLAGLGGKSEIMISATVVCLSTMLSEYAEWIQSVIPDIMNSVLLLLQYDNRQVIKSVLQFIKTALSVLDSEFISSFVPSLVKSLISFDGFASESIPLIKNIFTRLIKSYSFEKICELLPEEGNRQFLKNINKSIKKKKGKKEEKGNEKEMYLEQDREGDAIDMLDTKMMKNITKKPIDENEEKTEKMEEFDENIQFNEKKGKFVIKEDAPVDLKSKNKKRKRGGEEEEISQESRNEDVQLVDDFDEEIEDEEGDAQEKAPYQPQQKKKKVEGRKGYGEEYRGKRGAGGDVKRRDKPDPFAYIPLNPSEMNKRKKKESTFREFDAYSKAARKGAANNRRKKRY